MTADQARARLDRIPTAAQIGADFARSEAIAGSLKRWAEYDFARAFGKEFENGFRRFEAAWDAAEKGEGKCV